MTDQQRGQSHHTLRDKAIPAALISALSVGMMVVGVAYNDIGIIFGAVLVGLLLALSSPLFWWKDD